MKNRLFLFCCLVLFVAPIGAQTVAELEARYTKVTDKYDKMALAYQIAEKLMVTNATRASEFSGAAYKFAKELNDNKMMARSAYLGAQASIKIGKTDDAKIRLGRTSESAISAGDYSLASTAYNMLEDMAIKSGNYTEAYQIAKKQVSMYKASGGSAGKPIPSAPVYIPTPPSQSGTGNTELTAKIKTLQSDNEILKNRVYELESEARRLGGERDNLKQNTKQLSEQSLKISKEREEALMQAGATREQLSKAELEQLELKKREIRKQKLLEAMQNESTLDSIVYSQELQQKELDLTQATLLSERNANLRNFLLLGLALLLALAGLMYKRFKDAKNYGKTLTQKNEAIRQEQERSDELLLNILPAEIAEELKSSGKAKPRQFSNVSVLFTDFKNFTTIAEQLTPEALVEELDHCFKAFDFITRQHKVEKIKTIGDAYMCATGFNDKNLMPPRNLIQAAIDMQEFLDEYKQDRIAEGKLYFEARIGIHSGPVVAGVVGVNKFAYDIWGDTVNIAARMESNCEPGRINISESTFQQIKYDFDCMPRGRIAAKNKGEIEMYYVGKRLY